MVIQTSNGDRLTVSERVMSLINNNDTILQYMVRAYLGCPAVSAI